MHNWEFLPDKGCYTNGLKKNKKSFEIKNSKICVQENKFEPQIKFFDKDIDVKVRYINHAFLIVESKDFKFATDPWALGPAFNTGWWLKHKTIVNRTTTKHKHAHKHKLKTIRLIFSEETFVDGRTLSV